MSRVSDYRLDMLIGLASDGWAKDEVVRTILRASEEGLRRDGDRHALRVALGYVRDALDHRGYGAEDLAPLDDYMSRLLPN
jgi:hypothetical protein